MTLSRFVFAALFAVTLPGGAYAADGAKLYAAKCASCHAKDGAGNPGMAKALKLDIAKLSLITPESLAKTDEEHIKVTADGHGKMPAYKAKMTGEEITAVVTYIRTLAPKPAN